MYWPHDNQPRLLTMHLVILARYVAACDPQASRCSAKPSLREPADDFTRMGKQTLATLVARRADRQTSDFVPRLSRRVRSKSPHTE